MAIEQRRPLTGKEAGVAVAILGDALGNILARQRVGQERVALVLGEQVCKTARPLLPGEYEAFRNAMSIRELVTDRKVGVESVERAAMDTVTDPGFVQRVLDTTNKAGIYGAEAREVVGRAGEMIEQQIAELRDHLGRPIRRASDLERLEEDMDMILSWPQSKGI